MHRGAPHLAGAFFLLLLVPPVAAVLGAGFGDLLPGLAAEGWSALQPVLQLLQRPAIRGSVRFSLLQAGLSAVISVVLALPGAYLLAHLRFPGKRLVQSLTLLPFVLPSLIVVLAIISMYGRAGFLSRLFQTDLSLVYSPFGIILAHVLFNISVALRMISAGWLAVDSRLCDVSRSLGEPVWLRLLRLDLRLLLPSIVSALTVIFLYCFVSFGVVLIFGGVRWTTLEVRIYQEMFQNLNPGGAGILALLQIGIAASVVFLLQRTVGHRARRRGGRFHVRPWSTVGRIGRVLTMGYWLLIGLVFFSPLITLVVRAFRPGGRWSVAAFRALLGGGRIGDRDLYEVMRTTLVQLIGTSLGLAALSALLCTAAAYLAARALRGRRLPYLDTLMMLPLAISSVTLSLGMRMLWIEVLPPVVIIAITQAIMAFPMVFRVLRTALDDFPVAYTEAAQSVGGGVWFRLRTLDIPVLHRGILNAYVLAFALGLADFTGVLTIGRGQVVTFPVALYRLIGFQSFDAALALGVLYIAIVLTAFWIIDATSYAREQEGL
ncbi:ABC-type Fe3+ transport system, permease component [Spirochaeta africana DSM 8902]|uniref:ABC-type Fe3+ transport system, permease component n=2 Tax=Spirochaeta TaxID=146 RepID=H9UM93_SPIAZ|nr:ABC-type Fe3+ transport system, permease component [Spirochaeta africana DSM 8902]